MATLPQPTIRAKAFYAHLYDEAGALTKMHGRLYFVNEDDVTEVEPSMINFLVVLGEMQTAEAQRIADLLDGGPAAIACTRQMGVA